MQLNAWYQPGMYTITIPTETKGLYVYEVNGKWYARLDVPNTIMMDTLNKYQYEITDFKLINETLTKYAAPITAQPGYTEILPGTTNDYEDYTLMYETSSGGWMWWGESLGYIRQSPMEILNWGEMLNTTDDEAIEQTLVGVLNHIIDMYKNGMNVSPTDLFMDVWNQKGSPQMKPLNDTIVVVSKGYCPVGANGHCLVEPQINRYLMQKTIDGSLSFTVSSAVDMEILVGSGKIGDSTVYILERVYYSIYAIHNQTGIYVEKTSPNISYEAVMGPVPSVNPRVSYFDWYRLALLVDPTPDTITEPSSFPVVPNIPPPSASQQIS